VADRRPTNHIHIAIEMTAESCHPDERESRSQGSDAALMQLKCLAGDVDLIG
jgi:hypothetical protein